MAMVMQGADPLVSVNQDQVSGAAALPPLGPMSMPIQMPLDLDGGAVLLSQLPQQLGCQSRRSVPVPCHFTVNEG
jgi:hypothetical protein